MTDEESAYEVAFQFEEFWVVLPKQRHADIREDFARVRVLPSPDGGKSAAVFSDCFLAEDEIRDRYQGQDVEAVLLHTNGDVLTALRAMKDVGFKYLAFDQGKNNVANRFEIDDLLRGVERKLGL